MLLFPENIIGFALVCDSAGRIQEFAASQGVDALFQPGRNVADYLDGDDRGRFLDFLKELHSDESVLGWEMKLRLAEETVPFQFSASVLVNDLIIVGLRGDSAVVRKLQHVFHVNNFQLDQLRRSAAEKTVLESSLELSIYDQISQLNNELVSSIEVQNVRLKDYNQKLMDMATRDQLTGAYNRHYFQQKVHEEVVKAGRLKYKLVLLFIDFNNFKQVNDQYGHELGDHLLQSFAQICSHQLRAEFDILFRLGGDEFAILLPNCDEKNALLVAARINEKVTAVTEISSLSYGAVEILPSAADAPFDLEHYARIADQRMYAFKEKGRTGPAAAELQT